jgi:hypothetical protein
MQPTGDEQLFDFPNQRIVRKVKGNCGDSISDYIAHEVHFAAVSFEILQPQMNPHSGLKK